MKKTSALFILFLAAFNCFAQNKICKGIRPLPIVSPMKNVAVPVKPIVLDENKNSSNASATSSPISKIPGANNSVTSAATIIGNTTYDLQSNGSIGNKIYKSGNNIGVVWNLSTDGSLASPDRGTGYNFSNDNGATWQPIPTVRIESDRRGWPTIDYLASGGEAFISHSAIVPPLTGNGVKLSDRGTLGSGSWTESQLPPAPDDSSIVFLWPRMKTGGVTGNTIHEIDLSLPVGNSGVIYHGMDGVMTYSRSEDGGTTWNIQHQILPGMDSTRYPSIDGDTYAIDAKDNIVAICQGSFTNDWAIWKSTDNGTSWTKTVIDSFPIPYIYGDTIKTTTGSVAVLIDNNGMVHCWASYTRVILDSTSVNFAYFPMDDALLYWNENFGTNPPVSIASAFDADGNGVINISNFSNLANQGVTTMPSAGIDTAGNIFVTYSSLLENFVYGASMDNYRHVYCIGSPDGGLTWSTPYDISGVNDRDDLFPAISRSLDDKVHIVWERDTVPGLNSGTMTNNDILYRHLSTAFILNGLSTSAKTISGNIYFDANGNKTKDTGEINLFGQKVLLMPDNEFTYTDTSGNYQFYVYAGNYTVQYLPFPDWQITTDSASFSIAVSSSSITGLDFGSDNISGITNFNGNLNSLFPRCGVVVSYTQSFQNTGPDILDGEIKITIDTLHTFDSSSPIPDNISGDTLTWNYFNLVPFQQRNINLNLLLPGPTYAGIALTTTSIISYDSMSVLIPVKYDTLIHLIGCAMDPNDKTVNPVGVGVNHLTLMNEELKYTIRFQNTGTDTAFKVVIFDTLSVALDINTFEFLSSSHSVQTFLNANGALKFIFNNIHLPDSNVNEPASHGFVAFRISPKQGLPEPTVVNNHASIYFDFNAAVVTNTVFNTLVYTITGQNEMVQKNNEAKFYPNPFSDKAYLSFPNERHEKHVLKIVDITGRNVKTISATESLIQIQKGELNNGVYFYLLSDEKNKNIYRGKFVIN